MIQDAFAIADQTVLNVPDLLKMQKKNTCEMDLPTVSPRPTHVMVYATHIT